MPLPTDLKKGDRSGERLTKELTKWQEALGKAKSVDEIDLLQRMIAQRNEQLKDVALKDTAKNFGYQQYQLKNGAGDVVYTCTPAEELIRWRLWDRTGAGLMAELAATSWTLRASSSAPPWKRSGTRNRTPTRAR